MSAARTAVLAAALALGGCKKSAVDKEIARLEELADQVCACRDVACVEKIAEAVAAGFDKLSDEELERATPAAVQKMGVAAERYARCVAKVEASAPEPAPQAEKPSGPRPPPLVADKVLAEAYDIAAKRGNTVTAIILHGVTADGTLDPTEGSLDVRLGKQKTAQDGYDELAADCPVLRWAEGARASDTVDECTAPIPRPRCSVAALWKQAIAAGARPASRANIILLPPREAEPIAWTFVIDEAAYFDKTFADTCGTTP